MNSINTGFVDIDFLDDQVALITPQYGVEINAEKSQYVTNLIHEQMPSYYGMILNRKLKVIAIVVTNKHNFLPLDTEKRLFNGELEVFQTVPEAHEWVLTALKSYDTAPEV